jgi:Family of unknown function (DUF6117)
MALQKGDKKNFQTLLNAASNGHLALLECLDAASGETRSVVCAVNHVGEEYEFVPLAKLFTGNPYDEITPLT